MHHRHFPTGVPIGHKPQINHSVSKIFSIKVADKQTDRHTDMSTDNKGHFKM